MCHRCAFLRFSWTGTDAAIRSMKSSTSKDEWENKRKPDDSDCKSCGRQFHLFLKILHPCSPTPLNMPVCANGFQNPLYDVSLWLDRTERLNAWWNYLFSSSKKRRNNQKINKNVQKLQDQADATRRLPLRGVPMGFWSNKQEEACRRPVVVARLQIDTHIKGKHSILSTSYENGMKGSPHPITVRVNSHRVTVNAFGRGCLKSRPFPDDMHCRHQRNHTFKCEQKTHSLCLFLYTVAVRVTVVVEFLSLQWLSLVTNSWCPKKQKKRGAPVHFLCSHVASSVNHWSTSTLFSVTHLMLAVVFSMACSRASVAEPKPTRRLSFLNFTSCTERKKQNLSCVQASCSPRWTVDVWAAYLLQLELCGESLCDSADEIGKGKRSFPVPDRERKKSWGKSFLRALLDMIGTNGGWEALSLKIKVMDPLRKVVSLKGESSYSFKR